jgi:hypothetical protein
LLRLPKEDGMRFDKVVQSIKSESNLTKDPGMIRANLRRLLLASVATLGSAFAAHAQMPLPSLEPAPPLSGLYIGASAGGELAAR